MSRDSRDHPGRIIVKNYPSDTSSRDLQIMFEKYGKIDDLFTPKNKETDKPRGFTFIRYRRVEDAEDAIRGMNGRDIEGHKLLVEFSYRGGGGGQNTFGGSGGSGGSGPPSRGWRDSDRGGRGSRDDSRARRRTPSPRRFRSRSPSPRDHWRSRERDDDHVRRDERTVYNTEPYPPGPVPPHPHPHPPPPPHHQPPFSNMGFPPRPLHPGEGRMDGPPPPPPPPPPHGMPGMGPPPPFQPHPQGPPPPMGSMPPPIPVGSGPPPNHLSIPRKILLNTPPVGPPAPPGSGGPHGGNFDGPPRQSYNPPPSQREPPYRPSPHDGQYNVPPPHPPPPQSGGHRDSYHPPPPSRDSYGGPPPPSRGVGSGGSYSGSRGPPPDFYGNQPPPSRGYYDDQYNSSSSHLYPPPPPSHQVSRGEGYGPPSSKVSGHYHDDYNKGYEGGSGGYTQSRQSDDYYTHNDYPPRVGGTGYSGSHSRSSYRSPPPNNPPGSGPPPPPTTGYTGSRDYGNERSGYDYNSGPPPRDTGVSQGSYSHERRDYPFDGPPGGGYGNQSSTRQTSPFSRRTGYEGSTSYSRGSPHSSPSLPPARKSPPRDQSNENRFYGMPQATSQGPRRESRFSSAQSYGSQDQLQSTNQSYSSHHAKTGGGHGGSSSTQSSSPGTQNRGSGGMGSNIGQFSNPHGGSSKFSSSTGSSYSMSSFSTGYGAPPPSNQRQQNTGGSRNVSLTTNTGFLPSQSYTKPGPPF